MVTPQSLRERRDSLLNSVHGGMSPLDRLRVSVEVQELNAKIEDLESW